MVSYKNHIYRRKNCSLIVAGLNLLLHAAKFGVSATGKNYLEKYWLK